MEFDHPAYKWSISAPTTLVPTPWRGKTFNCIQMVKEQVHSLLPTE